MFGCRGVLKFLLKKMFKKDIFEMIKKILFICLYLTLIACRPSSPGDGQILATVAEEPIYVAQFRNSLILEQANYPDEFLKNPESWFSLKKRLLQEKIDEQLLLALARHEGVVLTSEEIEQELRQYKAQYSELSFQEVLQEKGVDPESWLQQKRRSLQIKKFLQKKLKEDRAVSLQQLLDYYEAHPDQFTQAPSVRVRQLVTDQESKARQLRDKLNRGANFAKLAQDHSLSPDRKRGGDLGFIVKGQVPEEFNICFELKPGELSEVVESPYGFHLFKVLSERKGVKLPFTQVKEKIRGRLQQSKLQEARENFLAELRQKYPVEINESVLKSIRYQKRK